MINDNSKNAWMDCARVLVLLISIASLQGCSTLFKKDGEKLNVKPLVSNDYHTPDMPPALVRCLKKQSKTGTTADELVINKLEHEAERDLCVHKLLAWYESTQMDKKDKK